MDFHLSWIAEIVDRFTPSIKRMSAATDKFKAKMKSTGDTIQKTSARMANFRTMMAAGIGVGVIAFPIKEAADFEDALINVQKVRDFGPGDAFAKFREDLFETAVYLGKMPEDIANISFEAVKTGIPTAELSEFVRMIGMASSAFDMPEKEAGALFATIKSKLGLTVAATKDVLDAINYISDRFEGTSKRTSKILGRSFASFQQIRMDPEQMVGWSAFADIISVTPQKAASGMRMMIDKMTQIPGMTRHLLKDPTDALKRFLMIFRKIPEEQRPAEIIRIFGKHAADFVRKAVLRMEKLDDIMIKIKKGKHLGSMVEEMKKKLAGAKTVMATVVAMGNTLAITFGDAFLPVIKELAPKLVEIGWTIKEWISSHPGLIKMAMVFAAISTVLVSMAVILGVIGASVVFLLSPFALVTMAILSAGLVLSVLYVKSEKVRNAFDRLFNAFSPIGRLFSLFSSDVDSASDSFSTFEWVISNVVDRIASDIETLFYPLELLMDLIEGIQNFSMEDISVTSVGSGFGKALTDKVKGFTDYMNEATRTLATGQNQKTTTMKDDSASAGNYVLRNYISGNIEVSAAAGAKVDSYDFNYMPSGDTGMNMRRP